MEYWNNYWSLNLNGDCFSLDGQSDLSRIMTEFWSNYFLKKGSNTYVLDLACGNGFVGKCAINNARNLYCIGADQSSDLGAMHYENKKNKSFLRLLPNMPVDSLQFVDNEFDFIVSQFGFEYSPNTYNVLANTLRQLKPNGELRLVIHNKESVIYERSVNELIILRFLLIDYDIFNKIQSKMGLEKVRSTIGDECNALISGCSDITESILANIYIFLDALLERKHIDSKEIDALELMYIQQKERLEEQIRVSHNKIDIEVIIGYLTKLNFCHVKASALQSADFGIIGWLVEACKPLD